MSAYKSVLFYDFETTGNRPLSDRPVQIGLVDGIEQQRIVMNTLVDPCMAIHPEATKVHGISSENLVGMPDFVMGLHLLHSYVASNVRHGPGEGSVLPIVAGYNSTRFDTPMADACYPTAKLSGYPQLDVLDVLYRYAPFLEKRTLSAAYQHFTGKELSGAHGAVADCLGTAVVLKYMLDKLNMSPEELVDELSCPSVYDIMPIGKHSGVAVNDVPVGWAKWMKNNAVDMRPDLEATVNHILSR